MTRQHLHLLLLLLALHATLSELLHITSLPLFWEAGNFSSRFYVVTRALLPICVWALWQRKRWGYLVFAFFTVSIPIWGSIMVPFIGRLIPMIAVYNAYPDFVLMLPTLVIIVLNVFLSVLAIYLYFAKTERDELPFQRIY